MFGEKDEFDQKEVTYTSAYLNNKSQRTKNASHISDFADLLFDVPQGSVADSLIFNNTLVTYLLVIMTLNLLVLQLILLPKAMT